MDFLREFYRFLKIKRKLWLAPIIALIMTIGYLLFVAQGSVLAPFIYTIF